MVYNDQNTSGAVAPDEMGEAQSAGASQGAEPGAQTRTEHSPTRAWAPAQESERQEQML